MLKLLLKKQMTEIFRSYFYDAKKNRARSKAAAAGYIVLFVLLMIGVVGGMFAFLAVSLCAPLADAGMDWLYFALMGLMAVFLGAFGSVFNTYSGLYLSKDNDLLLSLPISVSVLMASRLATVYLMGLMYSCVVILPAIIVYWICVSASLGAIAGGILFALLISVFVLTLSCALGWIVAKISMKLKRKSLITVIVSLVFFGAYYFAVFRAQELIGELIANAAAYGAKVKASAYPIYLIGQAGTGDPKALLIVSAAVLALFFLVWRLLSHSFLKTAASSSITAHTAYREKPEKRRSVPAALLGKELGRFLSSPTYMLNCALGCIIMPAAGVALLFKGSELYSLFSEIFSGRPGAVQLLLCAALCLMASMNDMSAPSVSLEGKNIWLAQSLPVTPRQVLRAKLAMHVILTGVPALICMACIALCVPCTALELVFMTLLAGAYILFMAMFCLFLGLKMPNLSWTNETAPIKQSACVLLALLTGFIIPVLTAAGFMLPANMPLGFNAYALIVSAVLLALCVLLRAWFIRRGSRLFAAL